MNGKRGRCAHCTNNKEDIKIMKQFKKLASLLLAAVLAMTLLAGCGGRGGNVGTAVTEQSLLKYINKTRANAEMGLSPVKNDPTLANAAAKLLEEFSKTEMVKTDSGTGYKLSENQVKGILQALPGKNTQNVARPNGGPLLGSCFWVAPTRFLLTEDESTGDFYLYRRGNKFSDPDNYTSVYGYGGTIYDFLGSPYIIMATNMKVGIAFREINGERFALLVYDVTITPATPAP